MKTKQYLMKYPLASIQNELALDTMLDAEINKRAKRNNARYELKSRLKKQPLTWQQRQHGTILNKDWFLAKDRE